MLTRGYQLFAGSDGGGDAGAAGRLSGQADRIAASAAGGGLPVGAAERSGQAVAGIQRLAGSDGALTAIVEDARVGRQQAAAATRVILDAAIADPIPAGDTPMGRREAMLRMIARLRAQHGHVVRTRAQAIVLAARLRRLLYLRAHMAHSAHMGTMGDAGVAEGASGRPAVLAAIRRSLDIKGIFNPIARARWERGMDLVASRESSYNANAINGWDSNAAKGTPSIGAWQFIQPTFEAYHEPGTSPNIRNLVSQACAFINYAQGRYGVAADASNLADRIQQADPRRGPRGY